LCPFTEGRPGECHLKLDAPNSTDAVFCGGEEQSYVLSLDIQEKSHLRQMPPQDICFLSKRRTANALLLLYWDTQGKVIYVRCLPRHAFSPNGEQQTHMLSPCAVTNSGRKHHLQIMSPRIHTSRRGVLKHAYVATI
jgi:hypothetical protein